MFRGISRQIGRLTYSWRAVGPGRMVRHSIGWATDAEARRVDSGFDDTYGTETNAGLTPREAGIPNDRRGAATMYLPTLDCDFQAMLAALPWPESTRNESVFVDIGSGKGRVVFLAAMQRFREVVGVELSPVLHEVASRNLEIMRSSGALLSPVTLRLQDATELEPPDAPLLAYLYHPFKESIAEEVMARLTASILRNPRPAGILYCHPTLQPSIGNDVFTESGLFRCVVEGGRRTRRYRIAWTIFTNNAWLSARLSAAA